MKSPRQHVDDLEGMFQRGMAIGQADIENDEMTFRFRKELFTFPCIYVYPGIATHNGYFYEAKVEDLRKLSKAKH